MPRRTRGKRTQRLATWERKASEKALRALKRKLDQQWREQLAAERNDDQPNNEL